MTALHRQVQRAIRREHLCPEGSGVLVGLSGGSDSVALTLILLDLAPALGVRVAAVAHLNHQLRATAQRDDDFCRAFAARVQVPLVGEQCDVRAYAASQRLSIEDAARRVRYDFLHRAANQTGADRVAVGHTLDDQAETVLMKLIRGAGPAGLAGIYPQRGLVVRPVLTVSRADLRAYLTARGEVWVEDETNHDLSNPRNRIRHQILPGLDKALGGASSPAIARAAALLRDDAEWLDVLAERSFAEIAHRRDGGLELDGSLSGLPVPIRRRVVLKALRAVSDREIGMDHVLAVLDVLAGSCAAVEVPGCRVELWHGKLVLLDQGRGPK